MPPVEDFRPLSAVEFHILAAMTRGPRHGYGIMQEVEARSSGSVRLRPGTLYGALKRMLQDGLVRETDAPHEGSEEERRRYYALTARGLEVLRADARRLEALVRYARATRILRPRPT